MAIDLSSEDDCKGAVSLDSASDEEYNTDRSGLDDASSEDDTESDEPESSREDCVLRPRHPPGKILKASSKVTSQKSKKQSRVVIERTEAEFIQSLRRLEPSYEIQRFYPPRFSSPTKGISYMSESKILECFVSLDTDTDPDLNPEGEASFLEFDLVDFCIYQSHEMIRRQEDEGLEGRYNHLHTVSSGLKDPDRPTHTTSSGPVFTNWLIDGTLQSNGHSQSFLRGKITDVNIGNLEDTSQSSAAEHIWIRTAGGKEVDYWYRLVSPSKEYSPFWIDFLWLADFVKFFIDFLHVNSGHGKMVHLFDFKSDFWAWLQSLHGAKIRKWHYQCAGKTDFRQHVLSHASFLLDQTIDKKRTGDPRLLYPIWEEIAAGPSSDRQAASEGEKTVVTANVASVFSTIFPDWQDVHQILEIVDICPEVEAYLMKRRSDWHFPEKLKHSQQQQFRGQGANRISKAAWLLEKAAGEIRSGQVYDTRKLLHNIIVRKTYDEEDFRYAWVRAVSPSRLSVVWLVLPAETLCGSREEGGFYPIGNELFFSDECNCEEVSVHRVVQVYEASSFTDHAENGADLFVHSLYRCEEQIHVAAKESELICHCKTKKRPAIKVPSGVQYPVPVPTMKVAALCSGAGLLDLAFQESSGSETILAVEYNGIAARSHRANNSHHHCEYHDDSINPVLKRFLKGEISLRHIDCILAGCPCQGFSNLNPTKGECSRKNVKNCSTLAAVLAYCEALLPALIIIENVTGIASCRPSACAAAISFLVSLGYQVRRSIKIDSQVGGNSIRERLFIIAAAPGITLPDDLSDTHGEGLREERTAGKTIRDLGRIENDTIINLKDPNHLPVQQMKIKFDKKLGKEISIRSLIPKISTSLRDAYHARRLSPLERQFFRKRTEQQQGPQSQALKRINPDVPFRTIATIISAFDARFGGSCLYPTQHRLLSLREICRAMGMPDSFLLAGSIKKKYAQAGNGVPWALGKGWGVEFGRVWEKTWKERGGSPSEIASAAASTSRRESTWGTKTPPVQSLSMERHSRIEISSTTTTTRTTASARPRRLQRVISDESISDSLPDSDTINVVHSNSTVWIKQEYAAAVIKEKVSVTTPQQPDSSERIEIDLTGDSDEDRSCPVTPTPPNPPTRDTVKPKPRVTKSWQLPITRVESSQKRSAPASLDELSDNDSDEPVKAGRRPAGVVRKKAKW